MAKRGLRFDEGATGGTGAPSGVDDAQVAQIVEALMPAVVELVRQAVAEMAGGGAPMDGAEPPME